jgi:iron complex outermembrane receptor protein
MDSMEGSMQEPMKQDETMPSGEVHETVQVTATRLPEDVEVVPVSITVVSGEEIRDRGARDLSDALGLAAGITVNPGSDNGPASVVPELWGLREADAYLLVVDGVPRGGAFNPDTGTVDLAGVERIEILRGAAPVLYGATSFVGVIHVIHYAPGQGERAVTLSGGSYGSGSASVELPISGGGSTGFRHGLTASYDDRSFEDDRAGFRRGSFLYRAAVGDKEGAGAWSFDLEGTVLDQDPASPRPRTGTVFPDEVPVDSNHNPEGAHIDQDRIQATGRYDRGAWSTTLSVAQSSVDIFRGFLFEVDEGPDNARGYSQDRDVTDIYFDSHYSWQPSDSFRVVAGIDHLYGKGEAESENFAYEIELDGGDAPGSGEVDRFEMIDFEDERNFSGLYAQATWTPQPRWRIELGARLNHTQEDREAEAEPIGDEEEDEGEDEAFDDSLETTRGSGFVGVNYLLVANPDTPLWGYANYRNTFKPAAIDFGPEAEGGILDPETAESYEVGLRGHAAESRLDWDLSIFRMDFSNLVLPAAVNGLPRLVNAGEERFEGVELESSYRFSSDFLGRFAASYHDATFQDYERLFDGVPFRLDGNRLELSAKELASIGLIWAPETGWRADASAEYVGSRFLDKRNRVEADPYTVLSAGLGYRWSDWEVRVDGRNLSDERDPVAESELGDAQYYLLPSRTFRLTVRRSW